MDISFGILIGIMLTSYVLPLIEGASQVAMSKMNIYIAENNLKSTEFAVKTQELVGKDEINTNVIGFQCGTKNEFDDFEYEDED